MQPEDLAKLVLDLLKNKPAVIRRALADYELAQKHAAGLRAVAPSLSDDRGEANVRHQLQTALKVLAAQSEVLQRLLLITLVGVASGDFDGQVTKLANRLGRGSEALRELWKQKLGGD